MDVLHILGKPEPWLIMFEKSYRQLLKFCGVPQSCGQPCSAVVIEFTMHYSITHTQSTFDSFSTRNKISTNTLCLTLIVC